jgi:hypothetical protein
MVEIKFPQRGSKWSGHDSTMFRVLDTIELEGHVWVHYIREHDNTEYSCYLESFLSKFREMAP